MISMMWFNNTVISMMCAAGGVQLQVFCSWRCGVAIPAGKGGRRAEA